MKRFLKPILWMLLGGIIVWAVLTHCPRFDGPRGWSSNTAFFVTPLAQKLRLTPDQQEQFESMEAQLQDDLGAVSRDHEKRLNRLQDFLSDPTKLEDQVNAQIDLVIAAMDRAHRLKADYIRQALHEMSDQQQEVYAAYLNQYWSQKNGSCPIWKSSKK